MPQQQQANADPNAPGGSMKSMMYIMPLFTVWIAFSFPVGVALYWIVGNIIQMVQQLFFNKYIHAPAKQAEPEKGVNIRYGTSRKKRKKS